MFLWRCIWIVLENIVALQGLNLWGHCIAFCLNSKFLLLDRALMTGRFSQCLYKNFNRSDDGLSTSCRYNRLDRQYHFFEFWSKIQWVNPYNVMQMMTIWRPTIHVLKRTSKIKSPTRSPLHESPLHESPLYEVPYMKVPYMKVPYMKVPYMKSPTWK